MVNDREREKTEEERWGLCNPLGCIQARFFTVERPWAPGWPCRKALEGHFYFCSSCPPLEQSCPSLGSAARPHPHPSRHLFKFRGLSLQKIFWENVCALLFSSRWLQVTSASKPGAKKCSGSKKSWKKNMKKENENMDLRQKVAFSHCTIRFDIWWKAVDILRKNNKPGVMSHLALSLSVCFSLSL